MPLSIKDTEKIVPFKKRMLERAKEVKNSFMKQSLDFILVIALLVHLFKDIAFILIIFILLYFADRWEIKNLFLPAKTYDKEQV